MLFVAFQGRVLQHQEKNAGSHRRKKVGDFTDDAILDMGFGAPEMLGRALPSTSLQEGNMGASRNSVRRARGLVADSARVTQERCVEQAVARDEGFSDVRCMKLGWDETEIRLYCSLQRARQIMPLLQYCVDDASQNEDAKRKKKGPKKPCFRMQCMQQCAGMKIGESEADFILAPMIAKDTAADSLYAAATGFQAMELLKKGTDVVSEHAGILFMSCHMDSLEANKNVFTKFAMDNQNILCNMGICEGCLSVCQCVV